MTETTKITELVTGLGMLGGDHPLTMLPVRPGEFRNVDEATWDTLVAAWSAPAQRPLVDAAFANGRYFFEASDALRKRRPRTIEWTGPHRSPGDEVAPVDLRVDHVYLVSCKYLSKITMNASPAHLFERLLTGGHGRRSTDWYRHIAGPEYDRLWQASSTWLRDQYPDTMLPADAADLPKQDRKQLSERLRDGGKSWPSELLDDYRALCAAVSVRSARAWQESITGAPAGSAEAMLWRLLRIGSAPYFVLGTGSNAAAPPLRLRVASPWDWRQEFTFRRLQIDELSGGQPMVRWRAAVTDRAGNARDVEGHVEIRWSHGRFSGPPEAKVYLDTPFEDVPGYWQLS